ncbi:MAG: nucleoside hydrolase [Bacteroidales bacterium]|nr:nucleoside hydrolase [Bacteroidales bacterium]
MKKAYLFLAILCAGYNLMANPMHMHHKHSVVIDTDGAIDDLRAISLLLSLPNITINAFMVSDGSLSPDEGVQKVRELLQAYGRESIPVYCGPVIKRINPAWRTFNRQIKWGRNAEKLPENVSLQQIINIIKKSPEKISLICLGPLTNEASLLQAEASIKNKIEDIIWYNTSSEPLKGFNYLCDTNAALRVLRSGIKTTLVTENRDDLSVFDIPLFDLCRRTNTQTAQIIYEAHNQPRALEKLNQNHFVFWDELVAINLINPELFSVRLLKDYQHVSVATPLSSKAMRSVFSDIVSTKYLPGEHIAFYGFPLEKKAYTYDVRMIMDSALVRYGKEEWKACVMTDEFHGHLGIFSIVGAKMGMRARDYFGIGTDLMTVVSDAGSTPPYSCMNDGIQVSTGATVGQGTISLSSENKTRPSAIFSYKGKSVRITLKPEYQQQVSKTIKKALTDYGLADENYWILVRQAALKFWLNWNRNKIFDLEVLNPSNH